ncbi:hypothetical protein ACFFX1_54855 [Dactylosporangium sucinum]|uniref:Phage FDXHR zinc binding domain-containing protein n=1 Tax=Dactylosporangium sucinum TaxID=1424081 RepID=A0A917X265_9ACTN|nr:hypothetical protein [Dactylosporangium sucinum]GGM53515.1 hypothetical protein GCM10007977_063880 [Dactylosporangium sucinum]
MTSTAPSPIANFTGTRAFEDLPHSCRCSVRWAGSRTCHCAVAGCHLTFTSVGAFDAHRKGGRCNPPAEVGLVLIPGRAYEVWGTRAAEGEAA